MATDTANTSPSTVAATTKMAEFVAFIADCCADTGSRAALRSGLGRSVDHATRLHRYLAPWTRSDRPHEEATYYTIAALIAHNPDGAIPAESPGNIGASLARCRALVPRTRETSVHLLARQPASALCKTLTRVVLTLRTADTPVDFALLLDHTTAWPWRRQHLGRAWLQSFYRTLPPGDADDQD